MPKEKLNAFHVALLIYMIEIDITVFSLPRVVAENLGTNGWVGVLLLGGVAAFNIFLIQLLYWAGNGKSVFRLAESVVPRWALSPFYASLAVFWLLMSSLIGRKFISLAQMLSYPTTNPMMIFFLYCLLIFALLAKDLYSIVKASTVFFLMTVSMNVLIPYFFKEWEATRFTRSIFQGGDRLYSLGGWAEVFASFVGYELLLFAFPYTDRRSKLFRGIYIGQAIALVSLLLIVGISSGFFSHEELKHLNYPIINMLEYLEMPFINRIENLIFSMFLMPNLIASAMYGFVSLETVSRLLPRANRRVLAAFMAATIFGFGFFFGTQQTLERSLHLFFNIEMSLAFALPLLLLPAAWYLKRKEGRVSG